MSLIIEKFNEAKRLFDLERAKEDGNELMIKVSSAINYLGANFSTLNGTELSEIQMKLAGYSFYLADYMADLQRISESLKIEVKEIKAQRWDEITEDIKAIKGKVSNKEQIENILTLECSDLNREQILYETMWYKYKLRLNALNDILTAVVQRISDKKRELEQTKSM